MTKNNIKLFEHQIKCVEWIRNNYGLILYHSMGSGKTITSLAMMEQFEYPVIIISTKASRKNFQDDIKKMKLDESKYTIITYQKAIKLIMTKELNLNSKSLVLEIASNDGAQLQYFKELNIPVLGVDPAENIAKVIYDILRPKIDTKFDLGIRLYETERNFVEYPA
jgi:SNF2 family DNA or RNA helicase